MSLNVEILSRIQFALTVGFHYIYPPLSIGLGVVLVIFGGLFLKTKDVIYHNISKFWTKVFGLTFAIGVATGIVMEFEFGTNWATYSRFVGDIFGSALAAEGIFAFFLESGFLAILLFGWNKVGPKLHFFATLMVCLGAHFSAVWIVIANSWMQTPAGYHLEVAGKIVDSNAVLNREELFQTRAVIDNFWEVVFNPSSMDRLLHVILGAWLAGGFLVLSISAYYLLKNRHIEFAKKSFKVGLIFSVIAMLGQLISGDDTARGVAKNQPIKLAAMEGLYETQKWAPLSLGGYVDTKREESIGPKIPGLLSFLVNGDPEKEVKGLKAFNRDEWPNVAAVFQFYHLMLMMAGGMVVVLMIGVYIWKRGILFDIENKWVRLYLWGVVFSVILPQIANQAGWFTAEMGRQPWVVYGLLKTSEGLSAVVKEQQVLVSLIMFTLVYFLLFCVFIYLLHKKIHHGPIEKEGDEHIPEGWQKYLRAE